MLCIIVREEKQNHLRTFQCCVSDKSTYFKKKVVLNTASPTCGCQIMVDIPANADLHGNIPLKFIS